MSQRLATTALVLLLFGTVVHLVADGPATLSKKAPTPDRWPVPQDVHSGDGKCYVVYVEAMPGESWDEKIANSVNRAMAGGGAAEIILPPRHIRINKPIRLWRLRNRGEVDTTADGLALADIRQVYTGIKGGRRQDTPRGITLRGTPGVTRLIWDGGPNQVVIDVPAPWHVTVRDLRIDGNNAEGLIGIRYRAGWEFGVNGGKSNRFENIGIKRVDVGIHVGGPFGPDLVGSSFRHIRVDAARIAFRLVGANVAEMWFNQCHVGNCEEAGFKLISHGGRKLRHLDEQDRATDEYVVTDADGREIFLDQLPSRLLKDKVNVPGGDERPSAGGGGPTCFISDLEAHMHDPRAWLVDTNWAPVRLEHVRMEGCAGVLRASRKGMSNTRFNDLLIDVNAVTTGGVNGYAIEYHKRGPISFVGGTFEGPIGLGEGTVCYSLGARFYNRQRQMSGIVPQGVELPDDSFFQRTGEETTVSHRRWPGERLHSGIHEQIGFVQLPGTRGARIHEMHDDYQTTVKMPAGQTAVNVEFTGVRRVAGTRYHVFATPNWPSGSWWVTDKSADGCTLHVEKGPEQDGLLDVLVRPQPYRGRH